MAADVRDSPRATLSTLRAAGAADLFAGEERLHEKIARAEQAMLELVEATREATSQGLTAWLLPSVAVGVGVAGAAVVAVLTQCGVRRATAAPVLGGFSPVSSKHASKKAW